MPVYEYECNACHQIHEVTQKFSDPPLSTCSSCGGSVKKLLSLGSFSLTGSGYYTTDYKRANPKAEAASCPPAGCGKTECSN